MLSRLLTFGLMLGTFSQAPARDSLATRSGSGTASVSGLVTLGDEAQSPVRRAVVTLVSMGNGETRSVVSDDEGRFVLHSVPDGVYALLAEKAAHTTMAFGARRPGRRGTSVVIGAGEELRDLRLVLPRGGVLSGRLTWEGGGPASDIEVVAVPYRLVSAGGTISPSMPTFRTDDNGQFRIYGIPSGSWVVCALPRFPRREVASRSPLQDGRIEKLLSSATPRLEELRALGVAPSPLVGFAPTYFPGTSVAVDALPVMLGAGDVRDDMDFTVALTPLATIRGVVTDGSGLPVQAATVTAEQVGPPLPLEFGVARVTVPNAVGAFAISGLPPGRYVVRARSGGVTLATDGSFSVRSSAQTLWARAELSIAGSDIEAFPLTLGHGLTFSGRFAADSPHVTPWLGAVVAIQPIRDGVNAALAGLTGGVAAREATADREGRFLVTGLEPDVYELSVRLPAALSSFGWTVDSVRHGARDLRDATLTFAEGAVDGVEIVMTTAVTELSGRITAPSGHPATDYFIVVFPDDRTLWHSASPRIAMLRPSTDGRFRTRSLPPGSYLMAALIDVEVHELKDPAFLESIAEGSVSVVLTKGRETTQDVRIR